MSERLFIYGALLSPSYLRPLVPGARFLHTGLAENCYLEFDVAPFLVPLAGHATFGAVYEVEPPDLRKLDRIADARCERLEINVMLDDGSAEICQAFVTRVGICEILPGQPPTDRYVEAMESGYFAHNAPEEAWGRLRSARQRAESATRLRLGER